MWIGYDGDGTSAASPGPKQHPHEVGEALLGADRGDDLALGVEVDVEPALVQVGERLAQLGDAAAGRVAMVAGVVRRLRQLLDGQVGRRDVGVAEAEVDDVEPGAARLDLQPVDDREDVRGQACDPPELHDAPPYRFVLSPTRLGLGCWPRGRESRIICG